jgi:hypothetical protein
MAPIYPPKLICWNLIGKATLLKGKVFRSQLGDSLVSGMKTFRTDTSSNVQPFPSHIPPTMLVYLCGIIFEK